MAGENGGPVGSVPQQEAELGAGHSDDFDGVEQDLLFDQLEGLDLEDETVQEVAEQTPYGELLLQELVRRQGMLALRVGIVFLIILLGLPLLNRIFPELVARRVLGLPLSWLALAVLVYPLLWLLGLYFVTTAKRHEDDFTELVGK